MNQYRYQLRFSESCKVLYNIEERKQKANKCLAVLKDYYKDDTLNLKLLDVGCSTGITTFILSENFRETIGIDIDDKAIDFAKKNFVRDRLTYMVQDSMNMKFADNTFDVIVCAQVYEHVPDSRKLMNEIFRVLRPGGICYFAAGNRIVFIEKHYKLPLLSIIPKRLAHIYLRLLGRGNHYYENHLTLWGLRSLTKRFKIIDYTKKIIRDPAKYYADDLLKPNSPKHRLAVHLMDILYFFNPAGYIWLLKKPNKDMTKIS